jgi:hypothetical protein
MRIFWRGMSRRLDCRLEVWLMVQGAFSAEIVLAVVLDRFRILGCTLEDKLALPCRL